MSEKEHDGTCPPIDGVPCQICEWNMLHRISEETKRMWYSAPKTAGGLTLLSPEQFRRLLAALKGVT